MDTPEIRDVTPPATEQDRSVTVAYVAALSRRFQKRGLAASARKSAEEQIAREEQTRALAPHSYRLSKLSQAALNGHYRKGKASMSGEDVLRYFRETRQAHVSTVDLEGNTGIDECGSDELTGKSLVLSEQPKREEHLPMLARCKAGALTAKKRLLTAVPSWMDFSRADTSRETRRFPLSAFAAVLVIAMSLMLIVASSVLLTRAESNISSLKKEISNTSAEVAKLKSDFEVQNDLLEIRRIAIEEYGMVDETYLQMEYISLEGADSVEMPEQKEESRISLSALLSAIGLK